ncbi:hypothetical protein INT47_002775 [Mucor saturninus]|uniref:Uncharacterized protein n=1 Tax=Mucor saturninus TaxID=64648 RepID=A0A8H7R038_9FUNG|nr:hypothetical protein INT47_002775 [Mucor saturninus]
MSFMQLIKHSSEIFSDVLKITYVLDNKGVIGFTKLIEATSKRRMNEAGQKVASRLLYTLKNEFIGYHTILEAALEDIVMLLPIYQENIKKMKEDGYEVVGYTRKSKGEKDDIIRIRLLNLMLEKMKTRSLADRVFVSPNLSANDPFNQRDENSLNLSSLFNSSPLVYILTLFLDNSWSITISFTLL